MATKPKHEIRLWTDTKPSDKQLRKLQEIFDEMPIDEILAGLYFAKNRWQAKDAGVLKVGRKSIIKKEVHSVTPEQAKWRLENWKMMVANYRRRGYSYPTISRIKNLLRQASSTQHESGNDKHNGRGSNSGDSSNNGNKLRVS